MVRDERLLIAEGQVRDARAQLVDTARLLASQLEPRRLARGAWESAKEKGADLAEDAVDAVTKRPVVATGIVAAVAMFLARDPIKDATMKMVDAMTSKSPASGRKAGSKAAAKEDRKPVPPPARRRARAPRRTATETEKQ